MPKYQSSGTYRSSVIDATPKDKLILHRLDGPMKSRLSASGHYWTVFWYDVETGELKQTHVDTTMQNYENWEHIVHDPKPYGVYEGLADHPGRKSRTFDMPVISADGCPERWYEMSQSRCYEVIELDLDQRTDPNNYHRLFE